MNTQTERLQPVAGATVRTEIWRFGNGGFIDTNATGTIVVCINPSRPKREHMFKIAFAGNREGIYGRKSFSLIR